MSELCALAIDIGHTRAKAAIVSAHSVAPLDWENEGGLRAERVRGLIPLICQVKPGPLPESLQDLVAAAGESPRWLGRDLAPDLKIVYDTPHTLGLDRVAAARGALCLGPGPFAILDAGTAWTLDFVSDVGVFEGGVIAPGVRALAHGLKGLAPDLPVVPLGVVPDSSLRWPGQSTAACLELGQRLAVAGLLRALLMATRERISGAMPIHLTGGDARLLAALWPEGFGPPILREDLVFRGLFAAYAASLRDA